MCQVSDLSTQHAIQDQIYKNPTRWFKPNFIVECIHCKCRKLQMHLLNGKEGANNKLLNSIVFPSKRSLFHVSTSTAMENISVSLLKFLPWPWL